MIATILKYEWVLFRRNKLMLGIWFFLLFVGFYALQYGHNFQQKQLTVIHTLDTAYQNRLQKQLNDFLADTSTKEGKSAYSTAQDPFMNEYYTRPVIWKQPLQLQALSIGQSDNQPYYNNIWLYNDFIYSNKETELRNPEKLLAGNFDLAFLLIYLLPLFVIAFSYSVVSSDIEGGIASLLAAQGVSLHKVATIRLLFRFLVMAVLVMVLNFSGFMLNNVNEFAVMFLWTATSLLYLLFWFAVVYVMVSFRKGSTITALLSVSVWILFLLLIPSFLNNFNKTEDAERLAFSDADREYSIHLWKQWQSKSTDLTDSLFEEMPHWKKYAITDTNEVKSIAYSYFKMLYMNRLGSGLDSSAVQEQKHLAKFNFLNPAFTTQRSFNVLAATELNSFAAYRSAAAAYQKQRAEVVHELRLAAKPQTVEIFKSYPVFMQPDYSVSFWDWLIQILPLLFLISLCFLLVGFINAASKNKKRNDTSHLSKPKTPGRMLSKSLDKTTGDLLKSS